MATDSLAGRQAGGAGAGVGVPVEVVAGAEVMINMGRALPCLPTCLAKDGTDDGDGGNFV